MREEMERFSATPRRVESKSAGRTWIRPMGSSLNPAEAMPWIQSHV
jgi:hypothetical protein